MNIRNAEKFNLFSRRSFVVGTIKISFASIIFGRLFYLQILNNKNYSFLSDNNRLRAGLIIPLRGKIYDRRGDIIVSNIKAYDLFYNINNRFIEDLKNLQNTLLLTEEQVQNLESIITASKTKQVKLLSKLNWKQISSIEENLYKLGEFAVVEKSIRFYHQPHAFSHLVGYVSKIEDSLYIKNQVQLSVGRTGVEKYFDSSLKGKPGIKKYEVNAKNIKVKDLAIEKAVPGASINLSLDSSLQQKAYELMKDHYGAAVMINIRNGEVITLVSTPSYDPNSFAVGISADEWQGLAKSPYNPMLNKAISISFPPGSSFKLIVCLAALKKGYSPDHQIFCKGYYQAGNRRFHCWKRNGHGLINMYQAIIQSCNCYLYETSRDIGADHISKVASEMGLGSLTEIELPGEVAGLVPKRNWLFELFNKKWQIGDTLNYSIGQGYIQTTPIQLALMSARIASGKLVEPTIIKQNKNDKNFPMLFDNDKHLLVLRKSMHDVINNAIGSGHRSSIRSNEMVVAGKTSTSQVIAKKNFDDDLSRKDINRKYRNHGLFIGYGPYNDPKYAICVAHEHSGTPRKAVKIANELLIEANKLNI